MEILVLWASMFLVHLLMKLPHERSPGLVFEVTWDNNTKHWSMRVYENECDRLPCHG